MINRKIIIGIVLNLLIVLILYFLVGRTLEFDSRERHLRFTTPLEAETVLDLCEKLDLQATDPLCDLEAAIYAVDYAEVLRERLVVDTATYDDFEEILGNYLDECYAGTSGELILCRYDLKGDLEYLYVGKFDEHGILRERTFGWNF